MVSACLVGAACAYDGGDRFLPEVLRALDGRCVIPACPEQLGGLPTPRDPAEIVGGEGRDVLQGESAVRTGVGNDVTEAFLRGAREVTGLAERLDCTAAVLKPKSPACSPARLYDGSFTGRTVPGCGVAARALSDVVQVILTPEALLDGNAGRGTNQSEGR